MDAKSKRLLLYAGLIALAWYATMRTGAGAGRAVDLLSGQPITPTEYYLTPAPMSGGGTAGVRRI